MVYKLCSQIWTVLQTVWLNMSKKYSCGKYHKTLSYTGTARSPRVARCVDGTISVDVDLDLRWQHDSTSDVRGRVSVRYGGALPWRQRWTRTQTKLDCLWNCQPVKFLEEWRYVFWLPCWEQSSRWEHIWKICGDRLRIHLWWILWQENCCCRIKNVGINRFGTGLSSYHMCMLLICMLL